MTNEKWAFVGRRVTEGSTGHGLLLSAGFVDQLLELVGRVFPSRALSENLPEEVAVRIHPGHCPVGASMRVHPVLGYHPAEPVERVFPCFCVWRSRVLD